MLKLLTLLCVVGVSMGSMNTPEDMLDKYYYMTVISKCFGEENIIAWKMRLNAASEKCQTNYVESSYAESTYAESPVAESTYAESPVAESTDAESPVAESTYAESPVAESPVAESTDAESTYVESPDAESPDAEYIDVNAPEFNKENPWDNLNEGLKSGKIEWIPNVPGDYSLVARFRLTRSLGSVDMSPEAIEEMKNELVNDLNNVTCVLREMKYMTYDNQIDYNSIAQEIMSLPVNDLLKGDLLAATQQCKDFATCLPFDKYNNSIDHEFGATIAFVDCIYTRKAMACMKDDMRRYAHLMGFQGDQDTEEGKAKMDEIASLFTHGLH